MTAALFADLDQAELVALHGLLTRGHLRANSAYETCWDRTVAAMRGEFFDVLASEVLPLIHAGAP